MVNAKNFENAGIEDEDKNENLDVMRMQSVPRNPAVSTYPDACSLEGVV